MATDTGLDTLLSEITVMKQRLKEMRMELAVELLKDAKAFCSKRDCDGDMLNPNLVAEIDRFLAG